MTDDAKWFVDLFKMQIDIIEREMFRGRLHPDKFDELSYKAWAIKETLLSVDEYSAYMYISVCTIRDVLKMQLNDYSIYWNRDRNKNIPQKYYHAVNTIGQLLGMTNNYVDDDY